jgi:hypothetical protein
VSSSASLNKVLAVGCFFSIHVAATSSFPLAGLAGQEREMEVPARCGGKGNGSSFTPVLVHGAEWWSASSSSDSLLLPACQGGKGKKESSRRLEAGSLFVKRGYISAACVSSVHVYLAGRGGEEVGMSGSSVPVSVLCP